MSEKALVEKILQGEKKAINSFYKTYKAKLLAFISQKVADKKDAEEILHDTFISALDSLPLFKFNSSLFTWLCSITRHEIADFYRKKKIKTIVFSHFPFLEKLVDQALSPELAMEEKELKQKISRTLRSLSEGYSQILRLKYIEGLSMAQISQKLGKTVKAVESKLFRARLAFQKEYGKEIQNFKEDWQIFSSSGNKRSLPF